MFHRIFDSERETAFKGMGFLTNRTVEYRKEKVKTCVKMPHYNQRQTQFGLLVWLLFLRARYFYEKSEESESSRAIWFRSGS